MKKIRWCNFCKRYTLQENCPICGRKTKRKIPPKFSPEDRWGKYRRIAKGMYDNKKRREEKT